MEIEHSLSQLTIKQEVNKAELDYTTDQLRLVEEDLYFLLHSNNTYLLILWRALASWTRELEFRSVEALVHPDFRALQKATIETLVLISNGVIEVGKLKPELHSLATTPLWDTPAYRFSEQRQETMRMVCQEAERLLTDAETLFQVLQSPIEAGMIVPAFAPRTVVRPAMTAAAGGSGPPAPAPVEEAVRPVMTVPPLVAPQPAAAAGGSYPTAPVLPEVDYRKPYFTAKGLS